MALISSTIPNLINGVSQQPPSVRLPSQAEVVENFYPTPIELLRRRPCTNHVAKIWENQIDELAFHTINRDNIEKYFVIGLPGRMLVFDFEGTLKADIQNAYLNSSTPRTSFRFLTINDYTFIVNRDVSVNMASAVTPTRGHEALVFIKQASYSTSYSVKINGTLHTTTIGSSGDISSTTVAGTLASAIGGMPGFTATVSKSTIWITSTAAFTCTAYDSRSNTHIDSFVRVTQRFSDLPTVAPQGYHLEVKGDQSNSFDNYYVKFETDDGGAFGSGTWKETAAMGIQYKFDAATLPHGLIRHTDGTFTLESLAWAERTCGDEDTAPPPSFVGKKINNIFYYRNRLAFLSADNTVMSATSDLFNFWPSTMTAAVDNDPIDVSASHIKPSVLNFAVPFSEGVVLFAESTQFLLEHDSVLSYKTVAVKPITEFSCSTGLAPIAAGKNIYFAIKRGNFSGLREYYIEEDATITDAADITAHVPMYIEGEIVGLTSSTLEELLAVISKDEPNTITCYKYLWSGVEKLQSAWFKWKFAGKVLAISFLESRLYALVQYNDGVYLEYLNVFPSPVDNGSTFEYTIDRKVNKAQTTCIYDASQEHTTITLPYPVPDNVILVGDVQTLTQNYKCEKTGEFTFKTDADLTTVDYYVGIPFTSRFVLSEIFLRETGGEGKSVVIEEGRIQLRNFYVVYSKSGYFEVLVTPKYRDTNVFIFTGCLLGEGSNILGKLALTSGTFRFPINCRTKDVTIEVRTDSYLPAKFTMAGWEGQYFLRSKRV